MRWYLLAIPLVGCVFDPAGIATLDGPVTTPDGPDSAGVDLGTLLDLGSLDGDAAQRDQRMDLEPGDDLPPGFDGASPWGFRKLITVDSKMVTGF